MEGLIEKVLLAGLGAFALTKERTEEIVEELIKRGEISKKDQSDFVKTLLERGKDTRIEIEKIVEKSMTNVLKKFNIPTKSDIDNLAEKLEELKKK